MKRSIRDLVRREKWARNVAKLAEPQPHSPEFDRIMNCDGVTVRLRSYFVAAPGWNLVLKLD